MRQLKISVFRVLADYPNPTLTPSVSISVIYPTFTNRHPRSCPTTAGAGFDLSLVAQTVKNLPAIQETRVQSLGQEDPLEKGMATPLQYSYLENSMDRGAWQATVNGVTKS